MAESSWPSPAAGRVVDDTQWEKVIATAGPSHGVLGDFTNPQLVYGDSTGRQIKVAADRYALVRGHVWYSGSSIVTVPITANVSGSTRIDSVVLRLSRTTWDVNLVVLVGTPGGGAATATQNSGTTGVWDMTLAWVTVVNNAATITAANVAYYGVHLDPMGGRVRIPDITRPWGMWNAYTGQEYVAADGQVVRWNGTAFTTINDVYRVAANSLSADSATFTTESGSLLSVTAPLINGEVYAINAHAAVSSDVAGITETAIVRVRQDTATGTQVVGPQVVVPNTSTVGFSVHGYGEYTATATGNKVFVLTGQRNGGTGNHQLRCGAGRSTYITVDHIG